MLDEKAIYDLISYGRRKKIVFFGDYKWKGGVGGLGVGSQLLFNKPTICFNSIQTLENCVKHSKIISAVCSALPLAVFKDRSSS